MTYNIFLKITLIGAGSMYDKLDCACGKEHVVDSVYAAGKGTLNNLFSFIKKYKKITLVSDINIYEKMGNKVTELLDSYDINYTTYIFKEEFLVPDELQVGKLFINIDDDADFILAFGAGTINDLCRFAAFKMGIDYGVIASAASMDGYCSSVSPLIVDNVKTTYEAVVPKFVIGETEFLKTAPKIMTCAGFGDILGKYVCLCDWQLGALLFDEYYCDYISGITRKSVETCVENFDDINNMGEKGLTALTEALCLSGTAMAYAGNSRPASGAEHHMAHFYEMYLLGKGEGFTYEEKTKALHGIKVGITTLFAVKIYKSLAEEKIDWDALTACVRDNYDYEEYKAKVEKAYGKSGSAVVSKEFFKIQNSKKNILLRIEAYKKNWDKITETIDKNIPSYDECLKMLKDMDFLMDIKALGLTEEVCKDAIIYAKNLRDRFTVLQIISDLNLAEKYSEKIVSEFLYS